MKTYTLTAKSVKGGRRGSWSSALWNLYSLDSSGLCRIGRNGGNGTNYATNFLFDAAELAVLRTKTIISMTLSINVISGTIPNPSSSSYPVGYKLNANEGSSEHSEQSWARSDADSTEMDDVSCGYLRNAEGPYTTADNTPLDIVITGGVVPVYGFVIGPHGTTNNTFVKVADTATLTVVTDEADTFTVTYDANGGSGAPAAQTKEAGTPLTLSSVEPVRSGYIFTGWNTEADGTGASYAMGAQYTMDAAVTMYAQWHQITQTGVWVKGTDGVMHQGTVWVKGTDGTMHEGTVYVKGTDGTMHQSS